ncbi:F-box protein At5g07610-like [Rhododendron vialii]|uniref:F-box protein At5g07610-like n=1 Tax=Rhododendron vialii TaxID=182163 RepID=UPI00265FF808|nr:F-box protein At5g07610-like [Rhododendron vialii]
MDALSDLPPTAEVIANNVDLLTQILLFLPAKSLIRFKSVSKQWLSLVSDSRFAAKHHCRNPRPSISGIFLGWKYTNQSCKCVSLQGDPTGPSLDYLHRNGVVYRIKIVCSSNGLLLCSVFNVYIDHYLVCNPTTQKYTAIHEPRPGVFSSGVHALLAFDPSKLPRYKVVFLRYCYQRVGTSYVQIDIYCSESASWKQIRAPCRSLLQAVFCRGVIYWFGYETVMSGFDVDSEKMIEMKKPLEVRPMQVRYFGECGGRLILIQTPNRCAMAFEILEMDKDDCRWIVKCFVHLGPLQSVSPQLKSEYCKYYVLYVLKGEMETDFELVLTFPEKTICYNLKSNSWNSWNVLHVPRGQRISPLDSCDTAFPYVESLYPL